MIDHLINFYRRCVSYTNNLDYPHTQLRYVLHNFNIIYTANPHIAALFLYESINIII